MTKRKKRTNNDLQNIAQKNIRSRTRTPTKNRVEFRSSGMVSSSCSTGGIRRVIIILVSNEERTGL
jgi:hypothetical protein